MPFIKVTLTKIVEYDFPVWGAFEFSTKSGETIVIHEKLSVIGVEENVDDLSFPMIVALECEVIANNQSGLQIDTEQPHGICDVKGRTRFQIDNKLLLK